MKRFYALLPLLLMLALLLGCTNVHSGYPYPVPTVTPLPTPLPTSILRPPGSYPAPPLAPATPTQLPPMDAAKAEAFVTIVQPTRQVPEPVYVRIYNNSDSDFASVSINLFDHNRRMGAVAAHSYSDYRLFNAAFYYGSIRLVTDGVEYAARIVDHIGDPLLRAGYYTYSLTPSSRFTSNWVDSEMLPDEPPAYNPLLVDRRWYWLASRDNGTTVVAQQSAEKPYIEFNTTNLSPDGRTQLIGHSGCSPFEAIYQLGTFGNAVALSDPTVHDDACADVNQPLLDQLDRAGQVTFFDTFMTISSNIFVSQPPQSEPPYAYDEAAALAPLLLSLHNNGLANVARQDAQFVNGATWRLIVQAQPIYVHVFAAEVDAKAASATVATCRYDFQCAAAANWQIGRFLITFQSQLPPEARNDNEFYRLLVSRFGEPLQPSEQ